MTPCGLKVQRQVGAMSLPTKAGKDDEGNYMTYEDYPLKGPFKWNKYFIYEDYYGYPNLDIGNPGQFQYIN